MLGMTNSKEVLWLLEISERPEGILDLINDRIFVFRNLWPSVSGG